MSGYEGESRKHVIYSATNMLLPSRQPINEIEVDSFNEEQIQESLKLYYAEVEQQKTHYKVFDPKEHLLQFKSKALPFSLLSKAEIK